MLLLCPCSGRCVGRVGTSPRRTAHSSSSPGHHSSPAVTWLRCIGRGHQCRGECLEVPLGSKPGSRPVLRVFEGLLCKRHRAWRWRGHRTLSLSPTNSQPPACEAHTGIAEGEGSIACSEKRGLIPTAGVCRVSSKQSAAKGTWVWRQECQRHAPKYRSKDARGSSWGVGCGGEWQVVWFGLPYAVPGRRGRGGEVPPKSN